MAANKLICWPPVLALVLLVAGMVGNTRAGNIAVYWGQGGRREGTLAKACLPGRYAYVILAFLTNFGNGQDPVLNLTGSCAVGSCTFLGADIEACQAKGVKVLLSLGGYSGSYGLSSREDADSVANYLWDTFLSGEIDPNGELGGVALDGIDFHITNGDPAHYDDLAKALRAKRKDMLLTAAPGCLFPDASIGPALEAVPFDAVWVRFYGNNPQCQYEDADPSNLLDAWNTWNSSSSVNAGRFYLGLPASANAEPSGGYIPAGQLAALVLPRVKGASRYGGIMLWNRFDDLKNKYSYRVKKFV